MRSASDGIGQTGWGYTMGRAVGLAMAVAAAAQLLAGGMACTVSMVSAVKWFPMFLFAQGGIVIEATAGVAGLSLCRALVDWVEVATLIAVGEGC